MSLTYDDALRIVLKIPSLEDEASGADCVVRCLFKPSFHPECSVSLRQRGAGLEITIRAATHSVWYWRGTVQGGPTVNPVIDWVEPAVSVEQLSVDSMDMAPLHTLFDAALHDPRPAGPAFGIDGVSVDVNLWQPGFSRSFQIWGFDEVDSRHRLVRWVLQTAIDSARWERSLSTLEHLRRHLRA